MSDFTCNSIMYDANVALTLFLSFPGKLPFTLVADGRK